MVSMAPRDEAAAAGTSQPPPPTLQAAKGVTAMDVDKEKAATQGSNSEPPAQPLWIGTKWLARQAQKSSLGNRFSRSSYLASRGLLRSFWEPGRGIVVLLEVTLQWGKDSPQSKRSLQRLHFSSKEPPFLLSMKHLWLQSEERFPATPVEWKRTNFSVALFRIIPFASINANNW